jgi:hypothetical protein
MSFHRTVCFIEIFVTDDADDDDDDDDEDDDDDDEDDDDEDDDDYYYYDDDAHQTYYSRGYNSMITNQESLGHCSCVYHVPRHF